MRQSALRCPFVRSSPRRCNDLHPPHTIVFANQAPDTRKLTLDRWRIVNLDVEKYVDTELLQELKAKRQRVALMKEEKMLMQRKALAKQRAEDELKELDEWLEGDGEE